MNMPIIGPRFSRDLPPHHAVLAVDLEGFTSHPSRELSWWSEAVPRLLEEAMGRSSLNWADRRFPQGTGDGFVLGLPPEQAPHLLYPFLGELQRVLEEESAQLHPRPCTLRMRVSVHLGPLPDSGGRSMSDGVGKPMNDVHRLLDCAPVREALRCTDPDITLVAAIVSERVFKDVVEAGYTALGPSEFLPVHARVKQFSEQAWLYVPVPSGDALSTCFGERENGASDGTPDTAGTAPDSAPGAVTGAVTVNRADGAEGLVVQAGSVNSSSFTTYTGGSPALPEVYPVAAAELDRARQWYVSPPGEARVRALLHTRHLVVLNGDPGGRRTTALHLLDELARQDGISPVDVVKHWPRPAVARLPLHTGCGYLLDLNDPAADCPDASFAEDLEVHAARLVDRGSYLIITVRPELWRDCRPAAALTVEPGRPALEEVLAVHLARLGTELPQAPDGGPVLELPPAASPGDMVELAELHASGIGTGPPALPAAPQGGEFLRLVHPDGRTSTYPLRSNRGPRARVCVGRAVHGDPPPDIVLDSGPTSWISRDHFRLEYEDARWWLMPRGRNQISLRRCGTPHPEPVGAPSLLRDGDVIHVRVQPKDDGLPRRWEIEFHDPQHTSTAR